MSGEATRKGEAPLTDIRVLVFDWGDTLMRDFPQYSGPMFDWPEVEIIPGVREALEQLGKEFVCCVASNAGSSDAEWMKLALGRVEIEEFFQHFFTSKELGFSKPDTRFFQEVIQRLKIAPREGLMVGDDYAKDIVPAKSIGMRTILFSEVSSTAERPYADDVITSMRSLTETIRRWKES